MFPSRVRRIAVATMAALVAGGCVGVAFAHDSPGNARDRLAAEDVYSHSTSLEEVARASTGRPGEVAPPCPPEDVVAQRKEAGLDMGPCDPVPEDGSPVVVAPDPAPEEAEGVEKCPAVPGSKGYPDLAVSLPCAPGAEILDAVPVVTRDGTVCMDLSYIARAGADETTERLCPGEQPAIGGSHVGDIASDP